MDINRGVALLIWNTHSHLCSALVEERGVAGEGGGSVFDLLFGFTFYLFGTSILRNILLGFFPLGFSQDKYLCSFCMVMLVYLSVILFICFCYEIEMKY